MKSAKIYDIKKIVDIQTEKFGYIYLVDGVWMLERQVKELMRK